MKIFSRICIISACALISVSVVAQEWTQFRGSGLNNRISGIKTPDKWPQTLTQVWKVNVGTGDASPVISGNRVYLITRQGMNEVAMCLNSETGEELWKSPYPAPAVTGPASSHPGPRSTPAIADGKVVTLGVSGVLSCFDAQSGKLLWRKENPSNAVPQFFTGTSPLVTDGLCIVHLGTQKKGEVLALNLATGAEKWKWSGDGPSYSSPSLMTIEGKKHVILLTEDKLIALDMADGKLLWQVQAVPQQRFYNCTSPYIDGQMIYFTGQGTGTKAIKVSKEGEYFVPKEIWSNPDVGAKWNTPVLRDGFLYGFTDQRRIYCINAGTGKTAWLNEEVQSDFATLLDCGDFLAGLPSTGNLLILRPDSKAYSEIVRYKVTETPVFAFPVLKGNSVYIKDAESLILYRIK